MSVSLYVDDAQLQWARLSTLKQNERRSLNTHLWVYRGPPSRDESKMGGRTVNGVKMNPRYFLQHLFEVNSIAKNRVTSICDEVGANSSVRMR